VSGGEPPRKRRLSGGRRYQVAAAARSTALLDELAEQTGVLPVALDVTNEDAVTNAVANVESTLGPIDLLVNNAGLGGSDAVTWRHRPADWWKIFEVNVQGTFLRCHAVVPGMVIHRVRRSRPAHRPLHPRRNR
jgi:NADP-dependent 3-hydroxy acid dehydrogenase YdfG